MSRTILETARLRLRELTQGDVDFVARMLAHPDVMHFYPRPYSAADAVEWIATQLRRYHDEGHGLWLALLKQTGEPVGQVGLHMQDVDGTNWPEIGYLLHRPYWGQGFATEAALAVRDHAFGPLDYARVISLIQPDNILSQAVARRLGMLLEGRTQHAGIDHLVFGLRRSTL